MNILIEYMDELGDVHKMLMHATTPNYLVEVLNHHLNRGDTLLGVSRYLG